MLDCKVCDFTTLPCFLPGALKTRLQNENRCPFLSRGKIVPLISPFQFFYFPTKLCVRCLPNHFLVYNLKMIIHQCVIHGQTPPELLPQTSLEVMFYQQSRHFFKSVKLTPQLTITVLIISLANFCQWVNSVWILDRW